MTAPLPEEAVSGLIAPLRMGGAQDGCKLLVGLDAPRVLWANRNAQALFGTTERLALSRIVFGSTSEGRPLSTRLGRLEPDQPPRLEGVQVASRFARALVVFRCRVVPGTAPKMILFDAAAAPARPEREVVAPLSHDIGELAAPLPHVARVRGPSVAASAAEASDMAARFTWRTGADGGILQIGSEMQALLGPAALQVGDHLENRLRALGSAPALDFAEALAAGRSWSGPAIGWPSGEAGGTAPVEFGGTPAPGHAGYRGYGLIHRQAGEAVLNAPVEDAPVPDGPAEPDPVEPVAHAPAAPTVAAQFVEPEVGSDPPEAVAEPVPLPPDEVVDLAPAEADASDQACTPNEESVTADVADAALPLMAAEAVADHASPTLEPPAPVRDLPVVETISAPPSPGPRLARFPRAIEPGTAKIVHLAAFKTGLPAFSGKAAVRREPAPTPAPPRADPEPLDAPQWAEAPPTEALAGDQRLSNHERFNFDEIARALATLPLVDGGNRPDDGTARTAADALRSETSPARGADPDLPRAPADPVELLHALAIGAAVTRGAEILAVNRVLLDLVGYEDRGALEQAGGLSRLFGSPPHGEERRSERQVVLTARDGTDLRVKATIRKVSWGGDAAMLWSVQTSDVNAAGGHRTTRTQPHAPDTNDLVEALELAATGVAFLDGQGRIASVNGGVERLVGYPERELIGTDCAKLFTEAPGENWTRFFADFAGTAPARHSAYLKLVARRRAGDEVPVGVSLRRIGPDRICMVWQQSLHGHATASELDLLRRDAERTSALKSEFLAKISHEIRTPLNAMLGFTEIIIEERFGPIGNDRYREYLKDIHGSGTHVVSLVNDLLDLSRIESGANDQALGPVDVNAVAAECVAAMQGQAYRDRIVIRSALASCAPQALADVRSLRQIVLNLLSNAVKFNEPGGQVILSTAISDTGRVLLRVRDTGPGMSESDIATALKPFRQLATPKAGAGTGLGLPLTKAMVEACQGSLRITSKPGDGTLVEVTFQRAPDLPVSLPAE